VDIGAARKKLGELQGREYWRSLEELLDTDDFREHLHREFRVPIDSGVDRRQLLTLMGASIALAGLTGCTRQPTERIYPYVKAPEELVPGEPLYYATAQLHQGYARGVLAKSYEGRPIKVDGNELHPASLGGSDVFIQGYILNMYDPDRSQTLTERGQIKPWSALLAAIKLVLEQERARRGSGLRFLTTTVTSPTLQAQIAAVLAELPEAKWIAWEPAGCENVFAGTKLAFGEELQPVYLFDKADVVLSLEADFLGSGPSMPRYVHDFVSRRRGESMNRLYAVESTPTLTGARADHRRPLSPAALEAFAMSVASGVGVGSVPAGEADPFAAAVAADLKAHAGASLVVAGDTQPPSVHALAHAMNAALGNTGKTVRYVAPPAGAPAAQTAAFSELTREMADGKVETLVIMGGNPVFNAPADLEFTKALQKVDLRIRLSLYNDETSRLCHWNVAEAHALESWSDARSEDGTATILQPLIAPLFSGRTAHELLAAFSAEPEKSSHDIVRDYWKGKLPGADFDGAWQKALHDGLVDGSAFPTRPVSVRPLTLDDLKRVRLAQGLYWPDTDILRASGGRLFAKIGAEAVHAIGVVGGGRGLALKIDDGGARALNALVMGLLERLGLARPEELERLAPWRESRLENFAGIEVGRIEAVIT